MALALEAGFYRTVTNNKAEVVAQNSEGQWLGTISHDGLVTMPALWTAEGVSTGGNAHQADTLTEIWVDPPAPEPEPEPEPEPDTTEGGGA